MKVCSFTEAEAPLLVVSRSNPDGVDDQITITITSTFSHEKNKPGLRQLRKVEITDWQLTLGRVQKELSSISRHVSILPLLDCNIQISKSMQNQ